MDQNKEKKENNNMYNQWTRRL